MQALRMSQSDFSSQSPSPRAAALAPLACIKPQLRIQPPPSTSLPLRHGKSPLNYYPILFIVRSQPLSLNLALTNKPNCTPRPFIVL
jgi:hypothetical protein